MIQPIIEHGVKPNYDLVDETGVMVKSVSFKGERDWVERKGSSRMISYIRGENPRLLIDISGSMIPSPSGNAQGLAAAHPGAAVTLANFTGAAVRHGFSATDNRRIVLKDAGTELTDEEEPQVTLACQLYPGIAV